MPISLRWALFSITSRSLYMLEYFSSPKNFEKMQMSV